MTLETPNGWMQYDNQIGTFRGMKNGVIYGTYTNEITTAQQLSDEMDAMLTIEQIAELQAEKVE
jgi:hypothetical protein